MNDTFTQILLAICVVLFVWLVVLSIRQLKDLQDRKVEE